MRFHVVTIFPEFFSGPFAHGVVAAGLAGAGQDQVARSAQAGECGGSGPQGRSQARDFGEAACDQCRPGVIAESQAVADAGGRF